MLLRPHDNHEFCADQGEDCLCYLVSFPARLLRMLAGRYGDKGAAWLDPSAPPAANACHAPTPFLEFQFRVSTLAHCSCEQYPQARRVLLVFGACGSLPWGCGRKVKTTIPNDLRAGGLCGPRLTAFAAFLKGGCHASTSTVQAVFSDVLGLPVSPGFVMKMLARTTAALDVPYAEALERLPEAKAVNADETGHKENGERWWTWVFRTARFSLYRIASTRGSKVLDDTLGPDFAGFLGADYFSAYRKYMEHSNALVQFCLAHLIRDVRFLCESTDKVTANYGERVLDRLRRLFHVLHRKDALTPVGFQRRLEEERDKLLATAKRPPPRSDALNLADRFREYGDEYVRFVTSPEIAPTNNAAEQAIRFCVIDRRITQGTRSEKGRQWCERIWTASATCAQQGRSLFRYIEDAITAHFHQLPAPSLIPA